VISIKQQFAAAKQTVFRSPSGMGACRFLPLYQRRDHFDFQRAIAPMAALVRQIFEKQSRRGRRSYSNNFLYL
jgi:hypothetical protein